MFPREDTHMTISVFLLDDHDLVRTGIRSLLETEDDIQVIGEASSIEQAKDRIPALMPQVAILDVRLPDGNGIDLCRHVRDAHPEIACLMLTSFADDEALMAAIMAGSSGYVLKDVKGTDFVSAVRSVAAGKSLLDPGTTKRLLDHLRRQNENEDVRSKLTPQEREVLDLIAKGLTNRQISNEIHLAEKTVKNYVSNILAKLGVAHRTEAAIYAVTHDNKK